MTVKCVSSYQDRLAKRQKEEIYWNNTKLLNLYHLAAIDLIWFHEVKFGVNPEMTE